MDDYYAEVDALMRSALDEPADDERCLAVLASVIGPPTFISALRSRGLSPHHAIGPSPELVDPWLERRGRTISAPASTGGSRRHG